MSELISNKEAFNAWIDGIAVEIFDESNCWHPLHRDHGLCVFDSGDRIKFRLKPRTITINGIEVPAPFKPKAMEQAFYIKAFGNYDSLVFDWQSNDFGYWRTEEEIRQVVAALRQIFK